VEKQVHFRLRASDYAKLKNCAEEDGECIATLLRRIVRVYLNHKAGDNTPNNGGFQVTVRRRSE